MTEQATFGMGCFWKPEKIFRQTPGVVDTRVGYAGGHVENPSYKQVCGGDTGHAEVVQVDFDPDRISYDALLDVFWANHDPTQRDRQGVDVGSQYRSLILTHNETQHQAAKASRNAHAAQMRLDIVTQIEPLEAFYPAEAYHQRYLECRA
ncbi:peptide-methionine (S)-S-oxide reductase MsrA [Salinisphaera sp. USBA-960]|uniref:peptide-methionine (S)-S-oxide reductase MsrA n=1 Tax=Salinisphaera orenii TaxID=856731 RepID=UPI000DBE86BF|nr:peptide-methionine (S)-S-oxide reductase MsrA [Salifodinibacter halophilus]NNC27049.1 peptide-methionine (S)-S-oxide reductase MsrA [Salifodinibacter halophilus]